MPTRRLTGSRIREKRLDLGLRQAAVAQAVGISPSYLNLIEHNRRRSSDKLLTDLARVLGVDAALLAEGAGSDLLDQMRSAATLLDDVAEVARTEELAARYPGWSALIVAQARRLATLEERIQSLTDRMAYDPHLAASLHEIISAVTAIRSSSSILVGPEQLDADWQRRFHENIHSDSLRLAASSEALITYLEAPEDEAGGPRTPLEEVEAYLRQTGFHLESLEHGTTDIDVTVAGAGLKHAAAQLLYNICMQYASDVQALPLATFGAAASDLNYDPAALAQRFDASFATVLRRLASLPSDAGHPPMGLVICDAAGVQMLFKPVRGFTMPQSGGACPLWPIFGAFSRPSQPIRLQVALPGPMPAQFLCYAVAEPITSAQFDMPAPLQSTMLVMPDPPQGRMDPQPVGVSCRICPRENCASRREPAMMGVAPTL